MKSPPDGNKQSAPAVFRAYSSGRHLPVSGPNVSPEKREQGKADFVDLPQAEVPRVLVFVEAEEEFDWGAPLSRDNVSVSNIAAQDRAQEIFARHGVVPTYLVDYPVASDEAAARLLSGYQAQGLCEIGAHLHPWVNPPLEEAVTARNSFPGNLPPELEREKLYQLTSKIEENFGQRPRVYRAGRHGVGPWTGSVLEDFGYAVGTSVMPYTSFDHKGGPDFRRFEPRPYWFGERRPLLELPLTVGFSGLLAAVAPALFPRVSNDWGRALQLPELLARFGLLERIGLTPEGADHAAHRRLLDSLLARGCRIFCLTYRSSSLVPGHTRHVRSDEDLATFLATIDRTLGHLLGALGGRASTATALYDELSGKYLASGMVRAGWQYRSALPDPAG